MLEKADPGDKINPIPKTITQDEASAKANKIKLTHTFQPVTQLQMTNNPVKLQKEQVLNLQPLKRDDTIIEINLRSIVNMDNEPMYFQQAFQGALVQTTNQYMERQPGTFSDDIEDELSYVMLFQLLGVPNLN